PVRSPRRTPSASSAPRWSCSTPRAGLSSPAPRAWTPRPPPCGSPGRAPTGSSTTRRRGRSRPAGGIPPSGSGGCASRCSRRTARPSSSAARTGSGGSWGSTREEATRMSGFNPRTPWSELERRLSDRAAPADRPVSVGSWGRPSRIVPAAAESAADGPAATARVPAGTPYAELHVHSDFSFLDGASEPEELVETAVEAGLAGLALTDHNGLYGAPRFAAAAAESGLPTVFGSELSIGLTERIPGQVDPDAEHLLVLARGVEGYRRLSAAITRANLRGEKNRP